MAGMDNIEILRCRAIARTADRKVAVAELAFQILAGAGPRYIEARRIELAAAEGAAAGALFALREAEHDQAARDAAAA